MTDRFNVIDLTDATTDPGEEGVDATRFATLDLYDGAHRVVVEP